MTRGQYGALSSGSSAGLDYHSVARPHHPADDEASSTRRRLQTFRARAIASTVLGVVVCAGALTAWLHSSALVAGTTGMSRRAVMLEQLRAQTFRPTCTCKPDSYCTNEVQAGDDASTRRLDVGSFWCERDVNASEPGGGTCIDEVGILVRNTSEAYTGCRAVYHDDGCVSTPCLNHGVCNDLVGVGEYSCFCPISYIGDRCESAVYHDYVVDMRVLDGTDGAVLVRLVGMDPNLKEEISTTFADMADSVQSNERIVKHVPLENIGVPLFAEVMVRNHDPMTIFHLEVTLKGTIYESNEVMEITGGNSYSVRVPLKEQDLAEAAVNAVEFGNLVNLRILDAATDDARDRALFVPSKLSVAVVPVGGAGASAGANATSGSNFPSQWRVVDGRRGAATAAAGGGLVHYGDIVMLQDPDTQLTLSWSGQNGAIPELRRDTNKQSVFRIVKTDGAVDCATDANDLTACTTNNDYPSFEIVKYGHSVRLYPTGICGPVQDLCNEDEPKWAISVTSSKGALDTEASKNERTTWQLGPIPAAAGNSSSPATTAAPPAEEEQ